MEYFTVSDIGNKGFYPVPEKLFNNKIYQKKVIKYKKIKEHGIMVKKEVFTTEDILSDTSKLMYGIMVRYLNFSLNNGWFDSDKRVYIKLSVTTLSKIMNKSRDTIVKCKNQLEEAGLLKIVKNQYDNDTFYLGKVKNKPENEIILEVEDRRKNEEEYLPKTLEVETIDQSKLSDKLVETIDQGVVETIDPIKDSFKVIKKSSSTDPAATSLDDFEKELKTLISKTSVSRLNANTLKNIKGYSHGDIEQVKRAIKFMHLKNKSMTADILVAILRDKDFDEKEALDPMKLKASDKIDFMTKKLGKIKVKELRSDLLKEMGFDGPHVDNELDNILCRHFNNFIQEGGIYV
jgi:hypothetical protein